MHKQDILVGKKDMKLQSEKRRKQWYTLSQKCLVSEEKGRMSKEDNVNQERIVLIE